MTNTSGARLSRAAIQRLYIVMRHLFIRGSYKPLGASGAALMEAMQELSPEIYGSLNDPERLEIDGLLYVFQRLPQGIEECRSIKLTSREGLEDSSFDVLIPAKRRRNCYRIDQDEMIIEMTRGRSDIYDVLSHLTFMYSEAEKIRRNSLDTKQRKSRNWMMLEKVVEKMRIGEEYDIDVAHSYLSSVIGRTFRETVEACQKFDAAGKVNSLFYIVYGMGHLSFDEHEKELDREITFSSALRDQIGHHVFGERWANNIKAFLLENGLIERPLHIISSNLHSVMNSFYAKDALKDVRDFDSLLEVAEELSLGRNKQLRETVRQYALEHGMSELHDDTGSNIGVQVFDCKKMNCSFFPVELVCSLEGEDVIIVMDYSFGEQAFELMDELLKPYRENGDEIPLHIESINIMGKAGILAGNKSDIMIPNAHIFEGSADNYPFENALTADHFAGSGIDVYTGPMITVLGTSLQNRDILSFFLHSSWQASGLEMEGAHYQKAIQAASRIRHSIRADVTLRYAYYASDNPLETGSTLSSGGLGVDGVKPTYLITAAILNGILGR